MSTAICILGAGFILGAIICVALDWGTENGTYSGSNEIKQIIAETRAATTIPDSAKRECITPVELPHPLRNVKPESTTKYTSLGTFKLTVYTPHCDGGIWGYQTATGARSEHLATCAVDPDVIPLGSVIEVGGIQFKAVDTGSAVKGNIVDLFFDGTQKDALAWMQKFGIVHEVLLCE